MAQRDGTRPQVTDPDTVSQLIRLLQIKGPVGVLDVADFILPTVSLGSVDNVVVQARQPAFEPSNWFTNGIATNQAANAVYAGTGPLPIGVYDIVVNITHISPTNNARFEFQHRNAADSATIANAFFLSKNAPDNVSFPLFYVAQSILIANERFRVINLEAQGLNDQGAAVILARAR